MLPKPTVATHSLQRNGNHKRMVVDRGIEDSLDLLDTPAARPGSLRDSCRYSAPLL